LKPDSQNYIKHYVQGKNNHLLPHFTNAESVAINYQSNRHMYILPV
jgi:hypothetical protein